MNRPIITVEGLGKQYAIGAKPASYRTLREALMEGLKAPVRRLRAMRGQAVEENLIWALKDVSFEIHEGEVVGIIGRNGAGKSTLLKILSRITDPTEGWAEIHGRVASLLEVGTGFHLELTGRENIYLNGAILGMRKIEIKRKFDEIVDFAEIEPFIDTPVKHYSSGMYVRLAFAVAAHLEPEILIVDEVLAVGDIAFQKKCLGKMEDVSRRGRTVLFVSHNMGAISRLCTRCIWINSGRLSQNGVPPQVIGAYIYEQGSTDGMREWNPSEEPGSKGVMLRAVRVCQPINVITGSISMSDPFSIVLDIELRHKFEELALAFRVIRFDGQTVIHTAHIMESPKLMNLKPLTFRCTFPAHILNSGRYTISVGSDIPHREILFIAENVVTFNVEPISADVGRYSPDSWKGVVGPHIGVWETLV